MRCACSGDCRGLPMEILGLLESAIGLVLIYLVLSLICSAWVEGIVNWTGLRGENLRDLLKILTGGDEKVANLLLAQPQLRSLFAPAEDVRKGTYWVRRALAVFSDRGDAQKAGFRPPSYIPPERFARALAEMALGESPDRLRAAPELLERRLDEASIREQLELAREQAQEDADAGVLAIPGECCKPDEIAVERAARHLSGVLNRLWMQSGGRPEDFVAEVEQWFEDGTDRAGGWFKRKLAPKLLAVGVVVAVVLNVDTLEILSRLSSDPELRQAVVAAAIERVETGQGDDEAPSAQAEFEDEFRQAKQALLQLEPLLGWRASSLPDAEGRGAGDWIWWTLLKLVGLLATAIALSLGAPFWFDVLQKLVRIRASVSQADVEKRDAEREQRLAEAGRGDFKTPAAMLPADVAGGGDGATGPARLVSGMVGLAPTADAPDRVNARWMAELASLAYDHERDEVEEALKPLGLNLDDWIDHGSISLDGGLEAIDTQGFVASNQDLVVVAFRGTETDSPADVLTDLQAWKLPMEGFDDLPENQRPRAHHGFVEALEAVREDLWKTLEKLGSRNAARPVWFVGHSLGGALAVLAAVGYAIWRDEKYRQWDESLRKAGSDERESRGRETRETPPHLPPVGWIYTVGQPAVGDERLAAWLEARFGKRLVRTVNNRDVVPRLPSPLIGYAHAGTELYFDSFGRMKVDPSGWYRGIDVLLVDPDKVRERARESVGDHDRNTYIGLLKGR